MWKKKKVWVKRGGKCTKMTYISSNIIWVNEDAIDARRDILLHLLKQLKDTKTILHDEDDVA